MGGAWKVVVDQRVAKEKAQKEKAWEQKRAQMQLRAKPTKRCCVRPVSIPVATRKSISEAPVVVEEKMQAVEVTDIEVRMESIRSLPCIDFDAILVDHESLHHDDSPTDTVSISV